MIRMSVHPLQTSEAKFKGSWSFTLTSAERIEERREAKQQLLPRGQIRLLREGLIRIMIRSGARLVDQFFSLLVGTPFSASPRLCSRLLFFWSENIVLVYASLDKKSFLFLLNKYWTIIKLKIRIKETGIETCEESRYCALFIYLFFVALKNIRISWVCQLWFFKYR